MVGRQRLGERGRRGICLLGFSCVNDRNEQVGKLREISFERLRALPPRQARCEHFVGIGADAEVTGRIPTGKDRQNDGRKNDEQSVAPAEIDHSGEQSLKCQ